MRLDAFLEALGSKKGAPGGGAAAALTGATGVALVEMISRLNDVRHGHSSRAAQKAAALRREFQSLIGKDAKAFEKIKKIYKDHKKKPAAWQSALKNGAGVPLLICEACVQATALAQKERARTSAWLESDRKESIILLQAAFESAVLNIEINLKGITDKAFNARAKKRISQCRRQLPRS